MEEFYEITQNKLNQIVLKGCEGIKLGDAIHYNLVQYKNTESKLLRPLRRILILCIKSFICDMNFQMKGTPNVLFLFSNSYAGRNDYMPSFLKVVSLVDDRLISVPGKKFRFKIRNYKEILQILQWNLKLKKVIEDAKLRWYCIGNIFAAYHDYMLFQSFVEDNKINIDYLVTWCDVHCIDSFFVQKFNISGKTTVTLQHGMFTAKTHSWSYKKSYSKYFLGYGDFTRDEAVKAGYPKQNIMLAVGLPGSIGKKEEDGIDSKKSYEAVKLGMFLDNPDYPDDNVRAIMFLQDYSRKYGKKLYFKFHPATHIEDYEKVIDYNITTKCYRNEVSVDEFGKLVDIVIVRKSTTLLQMLEKRIPVFIFYDSRQADDVYRKIEELRFCSQSQLSDLINSLGNPEFREKIEVARKYLCSDGNTSDNYIRALRQIEIL